MDVKQRAKLMVIDDEVAVTEAIQVVLKKYYEITVATDGVWALEYLQKNPTFDVILCDVHMGGITGIEIFKRLRESQSGLEQRMVFMTGGITNVRSLEFLKTVPNQVVEKPFNIKVLREAIQAIVTQLSV